MKTYEKKVSKYEDEYFAACSRGLEAVLEKELIGLGVKETKVAGGGVHMKTDLESVFNALLQSRIASRIYKKLVYFDIRNEDDLYYRGTEVDWRNIFGLDQAFKIKVIQSNSPDGSKRSKFKNSLFLTYKLKDSIIDSYKKATGERPDIDTKRPDVSFLAHVEPHDEDHDNQHSSMEKVSVSVDLSGYPLFKRGYRNQEFPAPLKETLAAGLIALTDWDAKAPFVDLMCGSGTFPMEAYLISSNTPSAYKKKDFETWSFLRHDWFLDSDDHQDLWDKLVGDLNEKHYREASIYAYDKSFNSIDVTKEHIQNIEGAELSEIKQSDALEVMPPTSNGGIVVMNPPYGDRLGDIEELKVLYKQLGDHLKQNWKGWRAFILIGDLELVKHVGLRTKRKHIVFNGPIECRWCEYELF